MRASEQEGKCRTYWGLKAWFKACPSQWLLGQSEEGSCHHSPGSVEPEKPGAWGERFRDLKGTHCLLMLPLESVIGLASISWNEQSNHSLQLPILKSRAVKDILNSKATSVQSMLCAGWVWEGGGFCSQVYSCVIALYSCLFMSIYFEFISEYIKPTHSSLNLVLSWHRTS